MEGRNDLRCAYMRVGTGENRVSFEVTHLRSTPHILFEFAPRDTFWYCPCDFLDILFECEGLNVFKYLVTIVETNRLAYTFDEGCMPLHRGVQGLACVFIIRGDTDKRVRKLYRNHLV
jgi:hypothetical protein